MSVAAKCRPAAYRGSNKERNARIFERDSWCCQYCGAHALAGVTLTADHIVPVSLGGEDSDDNLRTACFPCNATKSDRSEQWLRLYRAFSASPYAAVITLEQYQRLRGMGVALAELPAHRFYFELGPDER